jgi:hypothetical protein
MLGKALRQIALSAPELQFLHIDINSDTEASYDESFMDTESLASASNSPLTPPTGPEYPQKNFES